MSTGILAAYATITILAAFPAVRRSLARPPRRNRHADGADRVILVGVALLASAAWALLVPLYVVGWLRSSRARRAARRLGECAALVRARLRALARALRWAH